MKKDSYFFMPNVYPKNFCEPINTHIDNVNLKLSVEINYGGTETRISADLYDELRLYL